VLSAEERALEREAKKGMNEEEAVFSVESDERGGGRLQRGERARADIRVERQVPTQEAKVRSRGGGGGVMSVPD
jgi:hypothetical protein